MKRTEETQEAKNAYMERIGSPDLSVLYNALDIVDAYLEGAEWADEHPHWISVEEEGLPTKDGCYLFCAEGEPVYMCYYYADFKTSLATHWMPLPPAPKKGGRSR